MPVPEDQLPVLLPDRGASSSRPASRRCAMCRSSSNTTCPICGGPATRETDTMDTFICSSWYFLRYADPQNADAAWSAEKLAQWLPVDMYIGGPEHATLHLMYARFFVKALRDMGLLATSMSRLRGCIIRGWCWGRTGRRCRSRAATSSRPTMSSARYGADAVRCYLMFMGPFDQGGPWNNQGIEGVARFLNRVWTLVTEATEAGVRGDTQDKPTGAALSVERLRHKTIARVTADYEGLRFNTALAALMEYVNALNKAREEEPEVVRGRGVLAGGG